jgi:hypothetical protein
MRNKNTDCRDPHEPVEKGLGLFDQSQSRDEAAKEMGRYAESVRETSRQAYQELRDSGKLGSQTNQIYHELLRVKIDLSLQEISKNTGLGINAVSGRINEMKKKNLVRECAARKCSITQKTITPVKAI